MVSVPAAARGGNVRAAAHADHLFPRGLPAFADDLPKRAGKAAKRAAPLVKLVTLSNIVVSSAPGRTQAGCYRPGGRPSPRWAP
jgi:hypothetical protein